jgi:ABC-2 type transport system permease protein
MKKFISIVKREFRLFISNKIMLGLYLGGPILYGLLFGYVYNKGKLTGLPVVVVDNDHSPTSARLIDMLSETDMLKIKTVRYQTIDADSLFTNDNTYAIVNIPYDFEAAIMRGDYPELNTYINNTNLMPAGYVARSIMTVAGTLNVIRTRMAGKRNEVFHANIFRLYNPASNYFFYIWPSYLAIILQSVIMVVLALSFASEQETNSLLKIYDQSGNSLLSIMLGKLIPYLLLSALLLSIYGIYFHLFRQPYPTRLLPVLLISFIFITANCFVGMAGGLLFKTQLKSLQFLMVLSMPVYITSGFSWPYEQGGWAAQLFSIIFPFMPFVNGFRILLMEHGSLHDIRDYINLQLIQLVVYFAIAYLLLWWNIAGKRR